MSPELEAHFRAVIRRFIDPALSKEEVLTLGRELYSHFERDHGAAFTRYLFAELPERLRAEWNLPDAAEGGRA